MKKLKVAVVFGGTNTEHEVSIVSARSIMQHLDPKKYSVLPVIITKDNHWLSTKHLTSGKKAIKLAADTKSLTKKEPQQITSNHQIDVVFPVLHGPFGEDGTVQGLLELMHIPYVGCGVLSSALCMDKVVQKQLCRAQQIPTPDYIEVTNHNWLSNKSKIITDVDKNLGYPCFVKPANQGSSVGVEKALNDKQLSKSINQALTLDTKVIVEQAIRNVREIECSVLGNHDPKASVLGEIIPSNDFYNYDAKYIDGRSTELIPAKIPQKIAHKIQQTAINAFKLLNCSGLARVDFLVEKGTNKYFLNELNTMPGFTSISMYPKLWQASGISYSQLLDKLIDLALERFQEKSQINLDYAPKTDWHQE